MWASIKSRDVSLTAEWIQKWKSDKQLKTVLKSRNDLNAVVNGTLYVVTSLIIFEDEFLQRRRYTIFPQLCLITYLLTPPTLSQLSLLEGKKRGLSHCSSSVAVSSLCQTSNMNCCMYCHRHFLLHLHLQMRSWHLLGLVFAHSSPTWKGNTVTAGYFVYSFADSIWPI